MKIPFFSFIFRYFSYFLVGVLSIIIWAELSNCSSLQGFTCRQELDCLQNETCTRGWCVQKLPITPPKEKPFCPPKKGFLLDPPKLMSQDQQNIGKIVSDNKYLYWTDSTKGTISRQKIEQGKIEILHRNLGIVYNIAVDEKYIFATIRSPDPQLALGAIIRLPKIGNKQASILAKNLDNPKDIVLGKKYVYWNSVGYTQEGKIMKIPKDGNEQPQTLITAYRIYSIALDEHFLYWITSSDTGKLWRFDLQNKTLRNLSRDIIYARDIAISNEYIYYLTDTLWWKTKPNGRTFKLSQPIENAHNIVLDDSFAYIATNNSIIQIACKCEHKRIKTPDISTLGTIESLAIDARYLFLSIRSKNIFANKIFKMKKKTYPQNNRQH